nr:RNA-dependent RNA polymerase [Narnavirus sp.]
MSHLECLTADLLRTSAQLPRGGLLKVDNRWFKTYLSSNPGVYLRGWDGVSYWARRDRVKREFPLNLSADVIDKLCRARSDVMKRITNLIGAFQDNFMLSAPDWYPLTVRKPRFRNFIRWVISNEIYEPGSVVKQWKAFTVLVKWRALRSLTPPPDPPTNFPGFSPKFNVEKDPLPLTWKLLTPWLDQIWSSGLSSKFESTRLCHFLTSRNMPAATRAQRQKAVEEHFNVITSTHEEDPSRARWLKAAASQVGFDLRSDPQKAEVLKGAHLSVSGSASLESSVKDRGRGGEISTKFRTWAMTIPTEERDGLTWFGKRYWTVPGIPLWRTMCRDSLAAEGEPGDSSYIDDVDFTPGKFRYEDPLYCLDSFTGYQMLQWAIEEGIKTERLSGTPYRSTNTLRLGPLLPFIRASSIGEPGGKARIVTVGEGWLTIFLQPLSHALIEVMRRDPDASSGLSRAWQGFEYVKRMGFKPQSEPPPEEERFILTSDLKTATDFCPHSYSRQLLEGFTEGLGISSPYVTVWIHLLTSPRRYLFKDEIVDTKRGVLMGDPGTKLVLSLFNKVAELEARLRFTVPSLERASCKSLLGYLQRKGKLPPVPPFRLFAFAGDDHVAVGPPRYLRHITQSHIKNGMSVSTSTNFISRVAGFYCEECLFIGDPVTWTYWGSKTPLYKFPYGLNPHVDALKVRLLSPCRREVDGRDDTNPAIGMAPTLRGMLAWIAEGWEAVKPLASMRFQQKLRCMLPRNLFLAALPRALGGIELPVFHVEPEELKAHWDRIDPLHKRAIAIALRDMQSDEILIRRLLAGICSLSSLRGTDPNSIEEGIRQVLASELCLAKSLNDFRQELGLTEAEWDQLRFRDKTRLVEHKLGFMTVGEAIQVIQRPYVFRDILFPEQSLKHGIDPSRTRSYTQINWDERFDRFRTALLELSAKDARAAEIISTVEDTELEEARQKALSILADPKDPDLPREVIFIPKTVVYTDKLCTLQTSGIR